MAEPQLVHLGSEPIAKYFPLLNVAGFPIQCGLLNLDAIFQETAPESETIVLAIYKYARLVQRIFHLSDPTQSRSRQVLLPNTYAAFKEAFYADPVKYKLKLRELIGYGVPGFSHNPAEFIKYALFILFDVQSNMIVSGELVVVKQVPVPIKRIVFEVWGIAVDPLYLKSGAGTGLLLCTMYNSVRIVQYLYETARQMDIGILASHTTIELEVAKNSFPFVEFLDRFVFYARNGFSFATGNLSMLDEHDRPLVVELSQFEFASKYHVGNPEKRPIVLDLVGRQQFPLEAWKTKLSVSLPNPSPILFRTYTMNQYNAQTLLEDLNTVFQKIQHSGMNASIPFQAGWLSHSAYIPTVHGDLSMFKVPTNMEIIVMNSPGFSTYSNTIPLNWNVNAKYFRNVPMEYLQKLFPPFKAAKRHGEDVIPLDSYHSFAHATSGGVLFDIDAGNNQQYMQIHCYKGGDLCPDLRLVCELGGKTKDWLASMFGAYNLSHPTHYSALQMTGDPGKLDSMGGLLFPYNKTFYNRIRYFQWPDKAYREFPTQLQLAQSGFTTTESKFFDLSLKEIVGQYQDPHILKRICVFSCGNVEDALDTKIKQLWKLRINHTYKTSIADYGKRIARLGEAIYDIYNVDIGAYGLSPASKRVTATPFIMNAPAAIPVRSRETRRVSKALGSRVSKALGSRVSKALGSRGSKALGSRRVSKALGSRRVSKALGSHGSKALGSRRASKETHNFKASMEINAL